MASLLNVFYFDKDGNLIQLDDILARQQESQPEPVPPEPVPPEPDPSIVVIGGREYKTVTIGDQTWLAENLDFKFDGLIIGQEFETSQKPVATYYDNDESRYGVNGNKYGLLYNYTAAITLEERKSELIPGWHVPTLEDWQTLIEYVGGKETEHWRHYEDAGTKLKSTTGWVEENGDDNFDFNAYPAGESSNGNSYGIGESAYFWTSTDNGCSDGWFSCYLSDVGSEIIISNPSGKFSIRLIKD